MTADAMLEQLIGAYDNRLLPLPEGSAKDQAVHGMAAMLMARLRMRRGFDRVGMEATISVIFGNMAHREMENQSTLIAQQQEKLAAQK